MAKPLVTIILDFVKKTVSSSINKSSFYYVLYLGARDLKFNTESAKGMADSPTHAVALGEMG